MIPGQRCSRGIGAFSRRVFQHMVRIAPILFGRPSERLMALGTSVRIRAAPSSCLNRRYRTSWVGPKSWGRSPTEVDETFDHVTKLGFGRDPAPPAPYFAAEPNLEPRKWARLGRLGTTYTGRWRRWYRFSCSSELCDPNSGAIVSVYLLSLARPDAVAPNQGLLRRRDPAARLGRRGAPCHRRQGACPHLLRATDTEDGRPCGRGVRPRTPGIIWVRQGCPRLTALSVVGRSLQLVPGTLARNQGGGCSGVGHSWGPPTSHTCPRHNRRQQHEVFMIRANIRATLPYEGLDTGNTPFRAFADSLLIPSPSRAGRKHIICTRAVCATRESCRSRSLDGQNRPIVGQLWRNLCTSCEQDVFTTGGVSGEVSGAPSGADRSRHSRPAPQLGVLAQLGVGQTNSPRRPGLARFSWCGMCRLARHRDVENPGNFS